MYDPNLMDVPTKNNQPLQGTKIQHNLDCGLLKSETRDQDNEGTLDRIEDNACPLASTCLLEEWLFQQ